MTKHCGNCRYEECSANEGPCYECGFDGGRKFWEPKDSRREAKICAVQELCNEHEVCTDCPVHKNPATTNLCEEPFDGMSDEELDSVLSYFKGAEQQVDSTGYDKVQRHEELCDKIHSLYKKKNHDYGDSFGRSFLDYGPIAGLIRMEDKFNRLKTLVRGASQEVKDESIMDTLMDLANYSIMTLLEMEGEGSK